MDNSEDPDIIHGLTRCWAKKPPIPNNYELIPIEKMNILVISKPFDPEWVELFAHIVEFLQGNSITIYSNFHSVDSTRKQQNIDVFNDKDVVNRIDLAAVRIYSHEENIKIDRAITLGGDGTILFTVKMFYNQPVPPLITFGMGSYGYLCWFDANDYIGVLKSCLFPKDISNVDIVLKESVENNEYNTIPFLKYKDRIWITVNEETSEKLVIINSNIFSEGKKLLPSGSQLNALNELTLETGWFTSMFTVDLYLNDFLSKKSNS